MTQYLDGVCYAGIDTGNGVFLLQDEAYGENPGQPTFLTCWKHRTCFNKATIHPSNSDTGLLAHVDTPAKSQNNSERLVSKV